jgi:tetratricopeptide (TPR) repeat protein
LAPHGTWIPAVWLCLALALHAGPCLPQAPDASLLSRAEALVRAGSAEQAWQLLAPRERQHAGQPDFDYLLGVAALDSGRRNRATFIFERVIAQDPANLGVRVQMGRAYFELKDFERAEREFQLILKRAPDGELRRASEAYLAAMRASAGREQRRFTGYAEISAGRDTNVSAASAQSSVFVPGLGVQFVPERRFQRREDDFFTFGAGFEYAHALRSDLGVLAGADIRQRWHADAKPFDTRVADLDGALNHRIDERNALQYSIHLNYYELHNTRYRETHSLGAQWNRSLSARSRLSVSGQGHRIRYRTEDASASSSDLVAGSVGVTHLLGLAAPTTVAGAIHLGHDHAVAGRLDGDRRLRGASVALQRRLGPSLEGYLRFSVLHSDYDRQNYWFGLSREDRQRDAVLGLAWSFAQGWQLRPQVARTVNRSNLPISEYHRTETSITLRRVWD